MRVPFLKTLYPETATLSVDGDQARVICEELMTVAVRPEGIDGGVVSAAAAPVPDSITGYTLPATRMSSLPVAAPPTAGAMTTNMSQCVPGGMTPFQVFVARQWRWVIRNAPVTAALLSVPPPARRARACVSAARLLAPAVTGPGER